MLGKNIVSCTSMALLLLCAQSAVASPWPATVVGVWGVHANQSNLTMKITTQATAGYCPAIAGTLQDVSTSTITDLEGFYCPYSGRISFRRNYHLTQITFETWTGNLSDAGPVNFIGGTFTCKEEYGFFAWK